VERKPRVFMLEERLPSPREPYVSARVNYKAKVQKSTMPSDVMYDKGTRRNGFSLLTRLLSPGRGEIRERDCHAINATFGNTPPPIYRCRCAYARARAHRILLHCSTVTRGRNPQKDGQKDRQGVCREGRWEGGRFN